MVPSRWRLPPISLAEPTSRYLSFAEREEIANLTAQGQGVRQVARALGRDPGTISRELNRPGRRRATALRIPNPLAHAG